jgi:hypothetical protein
MTGRHIHMAGSRHLQLILILIPEKYVTNMLYMGSCGYTVVPTQPPNCQRNHKKQEESTPQHRLDDCDNHMSIYTAILHQYTRDVSITPEAAVGCCCCRLQSLLLQLHCRPSRSVCPAPAAAPHLLHQHCCQQHCCQCHLLGQAEASCRGCWLLLAHCCTLHTQQHPDQGRGPHPCYCCCCQGMLCRHTPCCCSSH